MVLRLEEFWGLSGAFITLSVVEAFFKHTVPVTVLEFVGSSLRV